MAGWAYLKADSRSLQCRSNSAFTRAICALKYSFRSAKINKNLTKATNSNFNREGDGLFFCPQTPPPIVTSFSCLQPQFSSRPGPGNSKNLLLVRPRRYKIKTVKSDYFSLAYITNNLVTVVHQL